MKSKRQSPKSATFEAIESRILFATAWGATATLVHQDVAAATYSNITGKGITVAVVDTGINYNVSSLGGGFGTGKKVIAGYDFVDNDSDPMDTDGHGTEVAGVIASNPFTYNGSQYRGVAPDAKLVALRVSDGADGAADSTIEKALQWIETNYRKYAIKVVNISLGSGAHTSDFSNSTLSDDFATLKNLGILVIAASGNSGGSAGGIAYPAADENVVSVGSVNSFDALSTFTQRSSILDLLAPGEDVPTPNKDGGFSAVDGTSFSSPYTAGTAALLRSADTSLTPDETLSILRASGTENKDGDNESGQTTGLRYSRLDILNAIKLTLARGGSSNNTVGDNAGASDIAYDQQGILHLAYYDKSIHNIRYATRGTDGLWSTTQIIDTSGTDNGAYLSISVDAAGHAGLAYFDATNQDLKYAHFNGSTWDISKLDASKSVGQFPSLAYDAQSDPFIGYYRKSGGDLRMLTVNDSGVWQRTDVDTTGDVGQFASLSLSDTAGVVAITYSDATNGDLKYARYLQGAWTIFTVDDLTGVAYTDLNIHNSQAFITYQDTTTGDLKFAKREGGTWHTETVYTPGNTGQYSSLQFDSTDTAHIVFYSKSKDAIYESTGNFGNWSTRRIGYGGTSLSADTTDDEGTILYVALNSAKRALQFGEVADV